MRRVWVVVLAAVLMSGVVGPAAADDDSRMISWGSDANGQLGDGVAGGSSNTAVAVVTSGALQGKRVTSVRAGAFHSCALAEGRVYCWGMNTFGQLGTGQSGAGSSSAVPVAVTGLPEPVTGIAAGALHTCAIAAGQAYCWGRNAGAVIGDGTTTDRSIPVATVTSGVLAGRTVTAIAAGTNNTCVLAAQKAYCWGFNGDGQLGTGSTDPTLVPVAVDATRALSGKAVTSIALGASHACAVADGKAYCWGGNGSGQVGDGSLVSKSLPTAVDASSQLLGKTVTAISAGLAHSCALANGAVYCWGDNSYGSAGNGSVTVNFSSPVAVDISGVLSNKTVTQISLGASYSCALADGTTYCWGRNDLGQLGDATNVDRRVPGPVTLAGQFVGLQARTFSAGQSHVLLAAAQAPTAPRALVTQSGTGAVTVSWAVPKDDGGRTITGYRVSTAGGSCETAGLSCTVTGLTPGQAYTFDVVARNVIGDSQAATVNGAPEPLPQVTPEPQPEAKDESLPQVVVKVKQSFSVPKKLKKRGVTVVAVKGAKTSAGQPVTTTVKTKGKVKVLRKGGAVKVRSFGAKKWRVTVTQSAAGTDTAEPFNQKIVYVNGKRR